MDFICVFISASFVWRFDKGKIGGKPGYRDAQSFSSTQLLSSNESNGWKNGRILTLPPAPSPRPNGERAGVRGFDLETFMPPHPDPLLPRGRRGRKRGQCQNTPDEPADNGINKLVMSQFGVRGHVRALEHRDMSRCLGKRRHVAAFKIRTLPINFTYSAFLSGSPEMGRMIFTRSR